MKLEEVKSFLRNRRGYLKEGGFRLAERLGTRDFEMCKQAIREVKTELYQERGSLDKKPEFEPKRNRDIFNGAFQNKIKPAKQPIVKVKQKHGKNVLIIGDLHLPFSLEGYLEHCIETYNKFNCNEVVFIGDVIDNHASSYHETDPDGDNAGQELAKAISQIKDWYEAFPKATVIIGNHDRLIMRKAYSSGLSKMWIRDYAEVLGVPGWNFVESIEIDDVLYIHGEGGTARNRVIQDLQSIVQGHLHTQCYVEWVVGARFKVFGMQVGCGIDHKTYAMAYAKAGKKPAIACGVVLKGITAINIMMDL
ncbi:MAG TPA: metallophosphoesterase [Allosphingosinicella sp.]|jgi:metallophosphoesterase superfamily enzyme